MTLGDCRPALRRFRSIALRLPEVGDFISHKTPCITTSAEVTRFPMFLWANSTSCPRSAIARGVHLMFLNVDIRRGNDSSTMVVHRLTPIRLSSSVLEPSVRILSTTLMAHRFIVASESINIVERAWSDYRLGTEQYQICSTVKSDQHRTSSDTC